MQNTLMPFKKGGFHPTLQGRKVYVAVGPFSSGPRCSRNDRSSLLGSHLKKRRRNRGFRERKELRKRATMEIKKENENMSKNE
jgi:hypothetical protein